MAKDMNQEVFDDATKVKLDIFGRCFEEWLPVFVNDVYTDDVNVFDFFAGSGKDAVGAFGSPLVLLDKAKGKDQKYCSNAKKRVEFLFNEAITDKSEELKKNIETYVLACKKEAECKECCYQYSVQNYEFKEIFSNNEILKIFQNKRLGKFVLLDQYGFSQIDENVFKQLINFPKTDFIFFISSSFISRFREHPNTLRYIDTSKISFDDIEAKEVHRAVASYFKDLIPTGKEYYLHHFSIQKNKGNRYGLILGSNHTLGMEKFLKVCWEIDPQSGEANYNIDNNWAEGTLFFDPNNSVKKDIVESEIRERLLNGDFRNNIEGLKFTMSRGCQPKLFVNVIKSLEKDNLIKRVGEVNNQSTNIHKAKQYEIQRINCE